MKKFTIQTLLLIVVIGAGLFLFKAGTEFSGLPFLYEKPIFKELRINDASLKVEMADTQTKRSKGLSGRPSLASDGGMLFIFPKLDKYPFWMKNTRIPLDMIFITENGKVADIIENATPCPDSAPVCPNYEPSAPAKFVLEVNAGVAKENGLKIGDDLISQ